MDASPSRTNPSRRSCSTIRRGAGEGLGATRDAVDRRNAPSAHRKARAAGARMPAGPRTRVSCGPHQTSGEALLRAAVGDTRRLSDGASAPRSRLVAPLPRRAQRPRPPAARVPDPQPQRNRPTRIAVAAAQTAPSLAAVHGINPTPEVSPTIGFTRKGTHGLLLRIEHRAAVSRLRGRSVHPPPVPPRDDKSASARAASMSPRCALRRHAVSAPLGSPRERRSHPI